MQSEYLGEMTDLHAVFRLLDEITREEGAVFVTLVFLFTVEKANLNLLRA